MRKGIEKGTDLTDSGYKFNTAEQLEKAAYKIQAHHCDTCQDTGWYGDNCAGRKGNSEYNPCDVCGRGIQADTTSIEQDCEIPKGWPVEAITSTSQDIDHLYSVIRSLEKGVRARDIIIDSQLQSISEKDYAICELRKRLSAVVEVLSEDTFTNMIRLLEGK